MHLYSCKPMKVPTKSKSLDSLIELYKKDLLKILSSDISMTHNGKYLHWHKLQYQTPPKDLDIEAWWLGIKFARNKGAKKISMKDVEGRCFSFNMTDQVQEMLHTIDSKLHGRIAISEDVLNNENKDRFIFNSLIEEAITSSQLEGAATTRQVAADMIRFGRQPENISERMILNNYHAIKQIKELVNKPLNVEIICTIQEALTKNTLDNSQDVGRIQLPGEKRVYVYDNASHDVLYTPPPAKYLPERMDKLCKFANATESNGFIHPIIRSIILHFWLAYEHPFIDGNGRTARALFYWSMLSQEYWLIEFISISHILKKAPARYSRAYQYTQTDENDLTYFVIFHLDVIVRAINELEIYLNKKIEQIRKIENLLKERAGYNHRQVALLTHAIRHSGTHYTIKSHQTSHNVAYATARADLLSLVENGILVHEKLDRKTSIFKAPTKLHSILKNL